MKKFLFVFLLGLIMSFTAHAQPPRLSAAANISLITCGPWQGELYSAFGHSAFRVYDPVNNMDWVFNYGTFDFNQPNFYLNFARGHNLYMLSVHDFAPFRDYYMENNRYIHEQVLNLDIHQLQQLFQYLWTNAQPENRQYRYDYFYDNCSTRPRDVLKNVFGDSVRFDYSWVKNGPTIRDLTDLYLAQQPWGDLGIDICLGMPMDKVASGDEHLFLPDFLEVGVDHASIRLNGTEQPLVRLKQSIYDAKQESANLSITHPWIVFSLMLAVVLYLTITDHRNGRSRPWLDNSLWTVTGILGLLLLLLWVTTDHRAAARNMNLLWAMPLNLLVPFLKGTMRMRYMQIMSVLTGLLLSGWAFLPQELNIYLIPVVAALLVRYVWNGWLIPSEKQNLSTTPG